MLFLDNVVTLIHNDHLWEVTMLEVGIRDLKTHLSDYVKAMQRGEVIAVKVRQQVVGFLSSRKPEEARQGKRRSLSGAQLMKKIEEWKAAGLLQRGPSRRLGRFEPVSFSKKDKTAAELLREIRDEE